MKLVNIISAALLASHGTVFAASAPDNASSAGAQGQAPRLGLGLGVVVSSTVYAGEDRKIIPVPLVSYESKRFFWRGIGGGVHLFENQGFSLDATLTARLDGIDSKDFGVPELAQRGIDRGLLEDRKDGLDLGLAAGWSGDMGELEFGIRADASGASKGFQGTIKYGYPMQLGATRITPHVGVSLMSKKLANYYFGTLESEVARGVVDYKPGSATVPTIGIDAMHILSDKWIMLGSLSYKALPTKITDSPLVKKDANGDASLFMGVSRRF